MISVLAIRSNTWACCRKKDVIQCQVTFYSTDFLRSETKKLIDYEVYIIRNIVDQGIVFLGVINKLELKALLSESDILLAVDMKIDRKERDVYLISKLLDYAAMNKKIMCITNNNSPAANFCNEVRGAQFSWDDEIGISNFIEKSILARLAGDEDFFSPAPLPDMYRTSVVSQSLIEEFERVICSGPE